MAVGFGSSEDVSGFKFLFLMAVVYGLMSMLTYSVIHMNFINPLLIDAPRDRFSEGRAIQHVRMLSQEIDGRQVSVFFFLQCYMILHQLCFELVKTM
jgi:hypothetical protein